MKLSIDEHIRLVKMAVNNAAGDNKARERLEELAELLGELKSLRALKVYFPGWIPCDEALPVMHKENGPLRKFVKQRSAYVIISIRDEGGANAVISDAQLWDGKWKSKTLDFLDATHTKYKVTAWAALPLPYKGQQ